MSMLCRQSNPSPSANIPDDLIVEILCLLNVKSLMKMKCVSKSWNTLISDPKFVKIHLNQSTQNSHFYAVSSDKSFVPFSVNDLLETRFINLPSDPYYCLIGKDCRQVVGSCNGLVCLISYPLAKDGHKETWFRLWNPATREISGKLGCFSDDKYQLEYKWKFIFGYDNSTDTYKVVALHSVNSLTTEVQVLSFGDNIWRNIQSFTARPLQFLFRECGLFGGVHLNSTVNWLARIKDGDDFDQLVIVSLDLTTETHTQLLPPPVSLEGSSLLQLCVCVLMNSLCFCHDIVGTDFVIWTMTKFGDENSWTQFLNFSYQNIQMDFKYRLQSYNLFEYGDTLVFTLYIEDQAILYNWRNNRIVKTSVDKNIHWLSINNYVESLVSTC